MTRTTEAMFSKEMKEYILKGKKKSKEGEKKAGIFEGISNGKDSDVCSHNSSSGGYFPDIPSPI